MLGLHKAKPFLENNIERAFKTANFFVINYLLNCNYLETLKKVEKKEFLLKIFQAIEENTLIFGRESEALGLVIYLLKKNYLKLLDRKELVSIYERLHLEDFDLKQSSDGYKLDLDDFLSGWRILKEKLKEHVLGLFSDMDLEEIYDSLKSDSYCSTNKIEFCAISLSLLERIEKCKGRLYYFLTFSAFLDEVFKHGLFDSRNLIIDKIIRRLFSQVNEDNEDEWTDLIFKIIHLFVNLSFYPLILPELLSAFVKLSGVNRARLLIPIIDSLRYTTVLSDQFSAIYKLIEKVLEKVSYIYRKFDNPYEFYMGDRIRDGARYLADLIYALRETRFLKLFLEPIKRSLSEIISETSFLRAKEAKQWIDYITTHVSWLSNGEVQSTLLNAIKSTPNYKRLIAF